MTSENLEQFNYNSLSLRNVNILIYSRYRSPMIWLNELNKYLFKTLDTYSTSLHRESSPEPLYSLLI